MNNFLALWRDESGAQLVEYALLVMLIAIVCVAGVTQFGLAVASLYNNAAGSF